MLFGLMGLYAIERMNKPGWTPFRLQVIPQTARQNDPHLIKITGGIEYLRRDSTTGWRRPHSAVWLDPREIKAWSEDWARETRLCQQCLGDGRELAGWDISENGPRYMMCSLCAGTGTYESP